MTHALNWALWTKLGDGVNQRGSDNDAERLRFDFSHNKALDTDELEEVEALVNGVIEKDDPVQRALVPLDEAMKIESLRAVFGENYPDPVRVVAVGLGEDTLDDVRKDPTNDKWRAASIELCKGPTLLPLVMPNALRHHARGGRGQRCPEGRGRDEWESGRGGARR